jgi:thymidylate kinase
MTHNTVYLPSIIHICGVDKTGKDTIRRLLVSESAGNYLVIVRSFMSQIVYSRIYNRYIDENFFFDQMKIAYDSGQNFVLLTASIEELENRFIATKEKHVEISKINFHKEAFFDVYNDCISRNICVNLIDTTESTPSETTNEIIERIVSRQNV